jgi:hypothetical protein
MSLQSSTNARLSPPTKAVQTHPLPCFQTLEGSLAEAYFEKIASDRDWKIEHSSPADDRRGWDFVMRKGEEEYKVDVKCMKRIRRTDRMGQDRFIWLELTRGSAQGWIYREATDLFAFEVEDEFIIVPGAALRELVEKECDRESVAEVPTPGKVYKRKRSGGDYDSLTLLPRDSLKKIAWNCWEKGDLMHIVDQERCDHVTSSETVLHREALEKVEYHSERLRKRRRVEIEATIQRYSFCPKCGGKLI